MNSLIKEGQFNAFILRRVFYIFSRNQCFKEPGAICEGVWSKAWMKVFSAFEI